MEFDKAVGDLFRFQMPQAELTYPGESITSPPCGKW